MVGLWFTLVGTGCASSGQNIQEGIGWSPKTTERLNLRVELPSSWEWSEAQGVWVANPKPPEDDAFVIALSGPSPEQAWEQTTQLLGLSPKPNGTSGATRVQAPFREGVGTLNPSKEVIFVAKALDHPDGTVMISAFVQRETNANQEGRYAQNLELISQILNSALVMPEDDESTNPQ